jgi:hypothetical protein
MERDSLVLLSLVQSAAVRNSPLLLGWSGMYCATAQSKPNELAVGSCTLRR